jgi:hypothetical protein
MGQPGVPLSLDTPALLAPDGHRNSLIPQLLERLYGGMALVRTRLKMRGVPRLPNLVTLR